MKPVYSVLAFLFLCLTVSLSQAAAATEPPPGYEPPDYGVTCAAHYADWQSGIVGFETDNKKVSGHPIEDPVGTQTTIFTCTLGNHVVRMNFGYQPTAHYMCGATADAEISVWLDGQKVVDKRQWATFENCMNDKANLQITRVLINDKLRLTVCDRLLDSRRDQPYRAAELKSGQKNETFHTESGDPVSYIQQCSVVQLMVPAGARDPGLTRTPPGIDLALNTSPLCKTISTEMVYFPDSDGNDLSLKAHRIAKLDSALKLADDGQAFDKSFTLDVDNDGVPDTLSILLPDEKDSDVIPYQYSWVSGKSGKTIPLTGTSLKEDYIFPHRDWADPVFSQVHFVSIAGRIYVYTKTMGANDALPVDSYELWAGTWGFAEPSRRLFELHPDGTATELCNWVPRQRPEEYL